MASGSSLNPLRSLGVIIKIRNSDRVVFKRCRRRWAWSWSHLGNMESQNRADPLWMGTGFHFAVEDFHSYKRWEHPRDAMIAYQKAWVAANKADDLGQNSIMPADHQDLTDMACSMLDYYEAWLSDFGRDPLVTYMVDSKYQVEVNFKIELPFDEQWLESKGIEKIYATGTIDRVIIDDYGRLWLKDYKSAKLVKDDFFDTDPQISMYCWAASILYPDKEIAGFIYQQHKKVVIKPPEFVKSTRMFSVDKRQSTTSILYDKALRNFYGSLDRAPTPCLEFLEWLQGNESERQDRFILRSWVERNKTQIENEYRKLLEETIDMVDPDLKMYPNPTRDCSWDCRFQAACIAMDDGSDYQGLLEAEMINRGEETETWKHYLKRPPIQSQQEQEQLY